MVIGIDETGNFDETSELRHLFIAAFIETENSKLERKREQFYSWEKSLDNKFKNAKNEVKGSLLGYQELQSFLQTVVFEMPLVRTSIVSIVPNKNPILLIEKWKNFEVQQIEYTGNLYSINGSKRYNVNFLSDYSRWLKKRTIRQYLKMQCLKHLLKNTFHNAVLYCILQDRIEEALEFRCKIDRDFLTEEDRFWNHYFKTSIENQSKHTPFTVLDTWGPEHPFRVKYTRRIKDKDYINPNVVFEHLQFLDSKDHFEIRIADIIGIVYNRFFNRQELVKEYNILTHFGIIRDYHSELMLEDFNSDERFQQFIAQSNQ